MTAHLAGWAALFASLGVAHYVNRWAQRSPSWLDRLDALGRASERAKYEPDPRCTRGTGPEQRRAQCRRGVPTT